MSNLKANRVSASLSPTDVQDIKDAIQVITDKLPFLLGLNSSERQRLPKISRANKFFVDEALQIARNNPQLMPPYFDQAELEKDYSLFRQLAEVQMPLAQLAEKVRDTQILAGSEAYVSALSVYRMVQFAAQSGIPGTDTLYDTLKSRFEGQGGTSEAPQGQSESTPSEPETEQP